MARVRFVGGFESSDNLSSVVDSDGAYMAYDTGTSTALFGAKGNSGAANRAVKILTLAAGLAVTALAFTSAGAATFISSIAATAATLTSATITNTSTALTLKYDNSHTVTYAVSSAGGLTVTTTAGQAVAFSGGITAAGKSALSAQTRIGDLFRVESVASPDTSSLAGAGVEITYDPTNFGVIRAYDYTAVALKHLKIDASAIQFTNAVSISAGGFTSTASTVATVSQVTTTTGAINARWTNNSNYTVELGYTGAGSIAYLWGTTGTGLTLGANGVEMLRFVSGGAITGFAKLTTLASASGGAGFNLPHGAAPSAPADGDMWSTTSGAFIRINGVTKTFTLT